MFFLYTIKKEKTNIKILETCFFSFWFFFTLISISKLTMLILVLFNKVKKKNYVNFEPKEKTLKKEHLVSVFFYKVKKEKKPRNKIKKY